MIPVDATQSGILPGDDLQRGAPDTPTLSEEPLLAMRGITKIFPGVVALDAVDFDLQGGEVHVLFGENGAGKSTLINIITGALRPTRGDLRLEGRSLQLHSVHDARTKGISAVFQEFSLAPDLTVEDNLFLGTEITRTSLLAKREMRKRAREALARLGFSIDSRTIVAQLSRAQRQMVEITKALLTTPRVLILDEPTSSLTEAESTQLFRLVSMLRSDDVGIIYITHRIKEIEAIGDRVTVLRDGRHIATLPVAETSETSLVELMTGRKIGDFYPTISHQPGETLFSVDELTTQNNSVRNVAIEVRAGEIVGLAGLVGCGKSEIGRACFGLERIAQGNIRFMDQTITRLSPRRMLARGLTYVPSDRMREGLMLERPTRENVSLSVLGQSALSRFGMIRRSHERKFTRNIAQRMRVTPLNMEGQVMQYSGGNQQKVLLAKSLARETRLFIFDEPTIGVDVGAKAEIYGFLKELVDSGVGILLISSELPEILNLCNRVYVVRQGQIAAHLQAGDITEKHILENFFSGD